MKMKASKACCLRSSWSRLRCHDTVRDGSVGVVRVHSVRFDFKLEGAEPAPSGVTAEAQSAVKIDQKSIMEKWGALCAFDALKSAERKARVQRTADNIGP